MRKIARELAFMLIYEGLFNKERDADVSFDFFSKEREILGDNALDFEDEIYVTQIVCLYDANKEHIETMINNNLFGYEPERVYKMDKALLCLAITEIYHYKTPAPVVVNEVVELAKKYSTENSAKFINGILGAIIKENPIEE